MLRAEPWTGGAWPHTLHDDVPLPATREWIAFMCETVGAEPLTLTDDTTSLGFVAVVAGEGAPPPANLRTILADGSWITGGRPERPGLDRVLARGWAPCLLVMYPGMATFPAPTLDPPLADVAATVDGIVDEARRRGCRVVAFPYVWPEAASTAAALAGSGFVPFPGSCRCDLEIGPGGFDGYLARLDWRRRGVVRRDLRHLRGAGVTTSVVPLDPHLDAIAGMRAAFRRRYRLPADEAVERGRLLDLRERFAGAVTVFASCGSDRVLRFSLALRHRDTWYMLWTAADYGDQAHRLTYFECLFYEPVRVASVLGVRRITYGLGAERAKRLRGCTGHSVTCFVRRLDDEVGG